MQEPAGQIVVRYSAELGVLTVRCALGILSILIISGCTPGSGKGLDQSGRPIGEGPDPGDEPTLANIQARVFTPICIACHVGAAAPQGLRLDEANSYNDLVGVRAREVGLLRVDPFNPDQSYLLHKVEGSQAVGSQMPLGGPPVPAEDQLLIRQWIADGALPNATVTSPQSIIVLLPRDDNPEVL
jgi:hypothetical protein